jgi:hypothetical protein
MLVVEDARGRHNEEKTDEKPRARAEDDSRTSRTNLV